MENPSADNPQRICRAAERRAMRPSLIDPNQWYSIDETAAALDKSRAGIYNDIASTRIQARKDGRRRKVHGAEIIRVSQEMAMRDAA